MDDGHYLVIYVYLSGASGRPDWKPRTWKRVHGALPDIEVNVDGAYWFVIGWLSWEEDFSKQIDLTPTLTSLVPNKLAGNQELRSLVLPSDLEAKIHR